MEFTQEMTSAITLGVPTQEEKLVQSHSKIDQGIKNVIFGSTAGMTGKLVEYPFDTVKTRLQAQPLDHKIFKGPLDCFKQTMSHEGLRGLYRGMSSPMVGAMLENAMLFLVYNHIQMVIKEYTTPAYKRHLLYNKNFADEISLDMSQLCMAGALSGAFASFVLTPVELIKCKLQVQESFTYNNNSSVVKGSNISTTSTPIYTGPLSVIKYTLKQHGITGFFRGHTGTFIRETGGGAIWFGTYEFISKWFMNQRAKMMGVDKNSIKKTDLSPMHLMTAGACAGMSYNLLVFPADSVKSLMQTEEEMMQATGKMINKRGFVTIAKDLYRADGIPGFYRGCGITVARAAPSSAIIFMTYELLRQRYL
ncbi:29916_t:CDS:2 [Gigaspora margarita]|uniref:29916_t:CDS:1 n=1 Tax=Gigaspora margarita TaxID=4874 RepID=A0ABN7VCR3_GIGMA|nr:29916_t:CDS:2 [Gigaspora margarita]